MEVKSPAIDALLSKKQVAELFGCTPRTIEHRMASGLPYIRFSPRAVRFRASDITRWLENQTVVRVG